MHKFSIDKSGFNRKVEAYNLSRKILHRNNYSHFFKRRKMMMATSQMTKQVLDFQRGAFSSWYGAMSILQEQAALTVDTMLNQASWIPDEGRQAILSWASACKEESDRYRVYVEQSFSGLEKYLVPEPKAAAAKPKTPAAEEKKATPAQEVKQDEQEPLTNSGEDSHGPKTND